MSNVKASCNICIGAATANPTGGVGPYTYTWTNTASTVVSNSQTATGLCTDDYTVTIQDANGCVTTQTVSIVPQIIVVVTSSGATISCAGACSGIATANASGGTLPYTYTWSPTGQTTPTATGLCAGTHTVVVMDANGCSNQNTITFIDPLPITATMTQTNVTCNAACNGVASANASGGTGVLSLYLDAGWSNHRNGHRFMCRNLYIDD